MSPNQPHCPPPPDFNERRDAFGGDWAGLIDYVNSLGPIRELVGDDGSVIVQEDRQLTHTPMPEDGADLDSVI